MNTNKIVQPAFAAPATEVAQSWHSHTAGFTVHWGRTGAVMAANGEIDAANADSFADYVNRCAHCCEWLILDLSALTFIGTAGFSALQAVNGRCSTAGIQLMVIPGRALSAVLRVCVPQPRLPLVGSLSDALADVQKSGRPLHAVR